MSSIWDRSSKGSRSKSKGSSGDYMVELTKEYPTFAISVPYISTIECYILNLVNNGFGMGRTRTYTALGLTLKN